MCRVPAALSTVVGDLTISSTNLSIVNFSADLPSRSNQHLPSGGTYVSSLSVVLQNRNLIASSLLVLEGNTEYLHLPRGQPVTWSLSRSPSPLRLLGPEQGLSCIKPE